MNFMDIVNAVKEVGLLPVMVILFILFQFRTIVRLEKYNEMLIKYIFEMKGGKTDGVKIDNRDNISYSVSTDSDKDREKGL